MQAKLGITADGVFGPGTAQAVREWQTKNGLAADGVMGPKSLEVLKCQP
jgi:peptidoglycan hydrolase-like protein with peptidoglycan-binding domain